MYQLIEKVVGNNQNFDISQSSLDLSIILFFRTEAFIKILIEAPTIPTSRDFLTKYCTVYTLHLQATTLNDNTQTNTRS